MKKVSIISPFYNEEKGADTFFKTVIPILEDIEDMDYEIVCINDGSTDNTFSLLKKWHEENKKIKVYSFARNFGKELALTCGLDKITGDCTIIVDSDLQHPPHLFPKMIEKWKEGYKVVLMQRRVRLGETWIKKITAKLFIP